MLRSLYLKILFLAVAFAEQDSIEDSSINKSDEIYQINRPPPNKFSKSAIEILMHLPPEFRNINSFLSYFQNISEGLVRKAPAESKIRKKVENESDVDSEFSESEVFSLVRRRKRQAEESTKEKDDGKSAQTEGGALTESGQFLLPPVQSALRDDNPDPLAVPILSIPEEIRRSLYTPFESDSANLDDSRNVRPVNDDEDQIQRDKRTFMENSGSDRETTTLPYWKKKKENPPFVTGRDGNPQKINNYPPAQHRSIENARESHSMKDLDKTLLSNEIIRNNQDSYFSSTNRRTYNSRQAENYTSRTPKSVYDTIDYTNRRRNQNSRDEAARNVNTKHQAEKGMNPSERFARQYSYSRPYDRPYFPFHGDVLGRGVEYYHRTIDPTSGRIIYYANMPDSTVHFDPNFGYGDPSGRSVYVNGRTYTYDPYGRSYIYTNDFRFLGGYPRSAEYYRSGRSNSDQFYQGFDKSQRNARYNGGYDRGNRFNDDFRNRTYIIFDAEENGSQEHRIQPFLPPDFNRFGYPPPPFGASFGPTLVAGLPSTYQTHPFRNQYYPTSQTSLMWGTNQKLYPGAASNYFNRLSSSPQVQIPLSMRNRNLHPVGDYDRMKKT